ncbi:MAG: helix-turn-helix transcriptional regulator, partial [Ktedonobacterales bacterium]
MATPAMRLLTALDLLQARSSITAVELAERLNVNTRSVRRYITTLQDIGIPIVAERGRYGGYRLRPGFKLPPLMLSDDEALAVTLGLLAARGLGLGDAVPAIEGALAKVERVLPLALRERVQAVRQTVMLDLGNADMHAAKAIAPTIPAARSLLMLSSAAQQGYRVRLAYRARDVADGSTTDRVVDPYGLANCDGRWYLVGYCHLRGAIRIFRLDRIVQLQLSEERFTQPERFDSLGYAIQAFAAIPDRWLVEVLLETTLEQVYRSVPAQFATLEETQEGVILRAYDRDLDHTARFLVGLGCPMHVRYPPELSDALRRLTEGILRTIEENAVL